MGATTRLSVSELAVTPGSEGVLDLLVENNGRVVDEFSVEALGDAAIWAEPRPASVRLLPGNSTTVQLAFRPPREASTSAGVVPFAVKVASKEDPEGTVVEEGMLTINPFSEAHAELLPTASEGRRQARYYVALDNRSNSPLSAEVVPTDPTGQLKFKVQPSALEVEANTAAFSQLVVTPRRTFWRGSARPRPFVVTVKAPSLPEFPLSGTMLQDALIPSWAGALALALVAALVGLAVLWSGVLRPTIQSTAKHAAEAAVAAPLKQQDVAIAKQGADLKQQAAAVKEQGAAVKQQDAAIKQIQDAGGGAAANPNSRASTLGGPFDGRLDAKNPVLPVKKGTLSVTDVFFENTNNDTGLISLVRDTGNGSVQDLKLERLDFIHDLDFHFVSPVTLTEGQSLKLVLNGCQKGAGSPAPGCSASVYVTGFLKT